jgi:hypothetical protein
MSQIKPGTMCLIRGSIANDGKIVEAVKFYPAGHHIVGNRNWVCEKPGWWVKGNDLAIVNLNLQINGRANERMFETSLLIPISDPDADVTDVVTKEREKEYV